jgi:hypothetical protein
MMPDNKKRKSPTRRFLLILGVAAFICFCTLGLMIIFWDKMPLDISKTQKIIFGTIVIVYAVIRFARILRKSPDEE